MTDVNATHAALSQDCANGHRGKAPVTDRSEANAPDEHTHDFLDAMAEIQRAGLGSLSWMGVAWVEALGDLGAEVASFIAQRIREDVQAQHKILHATSAEELRRLQGEFVQRAVDQYAAETGRLVALETALLDDAVTRATARPDARE